ncbi:hypothetical protein ALC53_11056 [Atta colombica]|uniref:Uncharacterized protein n=1 Tax=Atta colombica TaxID=520822 RepID=A0A195B1Q5_9HYME|nr:hypothetical protein ALC53_11056 [Atta colombica]
MDRTTPSTSRERAHSSTNMIGLRIIDSVQFFTFIQFRFYRAHVFCKYLCQFQLHKPLHFVSRYVPSPVRQMAEDKLANHCGLTITYLDYFRSFPSLTPNDNFVLIIKFRYIISQDTYLVACSASWFKLFRIMPLAEKHVVVHAISKIDQELFTIYTSKACRMIEETQIFDSRALFKKCVQQNKFYTHEIFLENFLYTTDVQSNLIPGGHEIIGAAGMFGIQMATIGPC